MGKFSILLCDSDEVYTKRLAAGLKRKFREQIQVWTYSSVSEKEMASMEADLVLGNQMPDKNWQSEHKKCVYLWLAEPDVDTIPDVICAEKVFKYQSVSELARILQNYLPTQIVKVVEGTVNKNQQWYGVISPVRCQEMIPFACTLASKLGEQKRVLLLALMEFSGITSLLGLDPGQGMEPFLLQLRQKERLEQVRFPEVHGLLGFDLLTGPNNPIVLYELNEMDVLHMIERICAETQYDCVVWVGGNMIRGIDILFAKSKQIFLLGKKDAHSKCCQQEFEQFFQMQQSEKEEKLTRTYLPVLAQEQTGMHLLWQWSHSVIGEMVDRLLKGDEKYGSDGTDISR